MLATPRRDFTAGTRFSPPSSLSRTFNEPAGERNTRGCVPLPRNDICSVELRGTRATACIMRDPETCSSGSPTLSPPLKILSTVCTELFRGDLVSRALNFSLPFSLLFYAKKLQNVLTLLCEPLETHSTGLR